MTAKSPEAKERQRAYQRAYMKRRRSEGSVPRHTMTPEYHRKWKARRTELLRIWKHAAGCAECGFRGHPAALEFDHVQGTKLNHVSKLSTHAWETIMAEIAKCDVVCANCHRLRTLARRGEL